MKEAHQESTVKHLHMEHMNEGQVGGQKDLELPN